MNSCIVAREFLTKNLLNVALPSLVGDDFEVFLRRTIEEVLDVAVCEVIDELDRVIFEEEESVVMSE